MSKPDDRATTYLLGLVIFVSAALLFAIQPMFAKLILPLLGGSPAVWNTCVVFYEVVLVFGYFYAHAISRLGIRTQLVIHLTLVVAALIVLPIRLPAGWHPPSVTFPVPWLLLLLCVSVGLPYFVVTTTSPLLQVWLSTTTNRFAKDPYFLYSASNAGSLVALLSYPLIVEPFFGLSTQSRLWSVGYYFFVGLIGTAGLFIVKAASSPAREIEVGDHPATPSRVGIGRILSWVGLAFIPSSLMLSVTTYLSTEIAPIPLLWVLPLALYLITLIVAFSKHRVSLNVSTIAALIALVPLIAIMTSQYPLPIGWLVPLHLIAFFFISLVCHTRLAADRPQTRQLTLYYLSISIGGALGGIFTAIVAPLVFKTVVEYPLVLVGACYVLRMRGDSIPWKIRALDIVLPTALFIALSLLFMASHFVYQLPGWVPALIFAVSFLLCVTTLKHPWSFAVAAAAIIVVSVPYSRSLEQRLLVDRDFFGISTVIQSGGYHVLVHSGTIHGIQNMGSVDRDIPLAYYSRNGPLGNVFSALHSRLVDRSIALVGLGGGATTCYAGRLQKWVIYEIDPLVIQIATNPKFFTLVTDCVPGATVVKGDARLSLEAAPDATYSMMILDAYSSDYIPVHLITREALALYVRKLTPNGVLVFHITNHHFEISPVLANLANSEHLACLIRRDESVSRADSNGGVLPSTWVVMARSLSALSPLAKDRRWKALSPVSSMRVWTDDYSSLITILRF